MKKLFALLLGSSVLFSSAVFAQDKSTRPSPPATATQKLEDGATITIQYSQPALKGRTIGKEVEPQKNTVWRMGANEATTFETDKDIKVEGKELKAGKYSMFGLWTDDGFELIFNSASGIWGTQYEKNKDKDVLHVKADVKTTDKVQERLLYTIDPSGKVTLLWGDMAIDFDVD
jgi:hypothetical protein